MSLTAEAMRILADKGLTLDEIIDVAAANGPAPAGPDAAERKRIRDRNRIAEKRQMERQSRDNGDIDQDKVSRKTGDIGATVAPNERQARARVEGNNLPTEISNLTTLDFASASWPEADPPSKADLERLEEALTEAAGAALASKAVAPKIAVLAPILRLAKAGKGPPCDLHADVLPVIRARSARAPPGSINSWDYFVPAITEARDRRLSGAPALKMVQSHERTSPSDRRAADYGRRLSDIGAAMDAAVVEPALRGRT